MRLAHIRPRPRREVAGRPLPVAGFVPVDEDEDEDVTIEGAPGEDQAPGAAEADQAPVRMSLTIPGQAVGDEHYIGRGDSGTDGAFRLLTVADADGDGRPDVRMQRRDGGGWYDVGMASPSTGATDATARAAAATAQGTADAAAPASQKWSGDQLGTPEGLKVYVNRRRYSFVGAGGVADWNGSIGTDNLPVLKALAALGRDVELEPGDYYVNNNTVAGAALLAARSKIHFRPGARLIVGQSHYPVFVAYQAAGVGLENAEVAFAGTNALIASGAMPVTQTAFRAQFGTTDTANDRDYNYFMVAIGCDKLRVDGFKGYSLNSGSAGRSQLGWFVLHPKADGSSPVGSILRELDFADYEMGVLAWGQDDLLIRSVRSRLRDQSANSNWAQGHAIYLSNNNSRTLNRARLLDVVEGDDGPLGSTGALGYGFTANFRGVADGEFNGCKSRSPGGLSSILGCTGCQISNLSHRQTTTYLQAGAPLLLPSPANTDCDFNNISINGDYGANYHIDATGGPQVDCHFTGIKVKGTVVNKGAVGVFKLNATGGLVEMRSVLTGAWSTERTVYELTAGSTNVQGYLRALGATPYCRVGDAAAGNSGNVTTVDTPTGVHTYGTNQTNAEAANVGGWSRSAWPGFIGARQNEANGSSATTPPQSAAFRTVRLPTVGAWWLHVVWSNSTLANARYTRYLLTNIASVAALVQKEVDVNLVGTNITASTETFSADKIILSATATAGQNWYLALRLEPVGSLA